jgi:hypothetical protein
VPERSLVHSKLFFNCPIFLAGLIRQPDSFPFKRPIEFTTIRSHHFTSKI